MSSSNGGSRGNLDMFPKLTLFLAAFMLLMLISFPLVLQSNISATVVPYLIYSSFLTSVGVLIGISLLWLTNSDTKGGGSMQGPNQTKLVNEDIAAENEAENEVEEVPLSKAIHLTESEAWIVEYLKTQDGKCWQSHLVKNSQMNPSKISRVLSKMESRGLIERIRDGMGKRVILTETEGL
jgi:uncharacterized membrane protein